MYFQTVLLSAGISSPTRHLSVLGELGTTASYLSVCMSAEGLLDRTLGGNRWGPFGEN